VLTVHLLKYKATDMRFIMLLYRGAR